MIDSTPALLLTLLAIPGVALLVAVRLLFGEQWDAKGTMRMQLSLLGWLNVWLAAVGIVLGTSGSTPLVVVLLLTAAVVALMVWIRLRRAEHRALVGAIASGVPRGVPIAEMARTFAGERETAGGTRGRAHMLAALVEGGMPLDAAVARTPLWLGTDLTVAIRTGTALGALGPALERELESSREMEDVLRPLAPRLWYLAVAITLASGIVTFVMLKIVPVFDRLFLDFDLALPTPTVWLVNMARFVVDLGPLAMLPYLAIGGMLIAGTLLYLDIFPRNLPLLDRMFRRYDGAIVLRNLALAIERSLPMPKALDLIGKVYTLGSVGRSLIAAGQQVAAGAGWCESLLRTRLIGPADAAVLSAAERAGNLPWAMREVADSLLRREAYRWQWWLNILSPLVTVLFGLCVAMIIIPLFLPLIVLIEAVSR